MGAVVGTAVGSGEQSGVETNRRLGMAGMFVAVWADFVGLSGVVIDADRGMNVSGEYSCMLGFHLG
jgi:hypothetical protein